MTAMNRSRAKVEARRRRNERARIAALPDADLARYLSHAVQWGAKAEYRAAMHEVLVVRGSARFPDPNS